MATAKPLSPGRRVLWAGCCVLLGVLCALTFAQWKHRQAAAATVERIDLQDDTTVIALTSPEVLLDKVYHSMEGPRFNHESLAIGDSDTPDKIVYVTGLRTDLHDAESDAPISKEFFCHANLTLNTEAHSIEQHNTQFFPTPKHLNSTLFTLVPGRMDVQFPKGFGIPVRAKTKLDCYLMALNQNPGLPERRLRMKTQIKLEQDKPLIPLFMRTPVLYQKFKQPETQHETSIPKLALGLNFDEIHPGELCAQSCDENLLAQLPSRFFSVDAANHGPGFDQYCCVSNASIGGILEQFGDDHTIHWMVPPGQHTYKAEVTTQFKLPFDTTAHYITGHLHPMGKRLLLRDLDTGEIVFEINARCMDDRLGVLEMSAIESTAGIPILTDHRYELEAEYNNTSDKPLDAMAILYVYLRDEAPADSLVETAPALTRVE